MTLERDAQSLRPQRFGLGLIRLWLTAINPALICMGLLQAAYGIAIAHSIGRTHPLRVVLLIAFVLAEAAAVRLINDYDDYRRGIDTRESVRPNSALALGLDMHTVRNVGYSAVLFMVLDATTLILLVNPWFFLLLPIPFLALFLYSGGPRPLGHLALGEAIDFAVNGGGAVFGIVLISAGTISFAAGLACIGVGFLYATLMLHNNIRDVEKDQAVKKRTLPQIVGATNSKIFYILFLSMSYVSVGACALTTGNTHLLLPLVTLPWATVLVLRVVRSSLGASLFPWRDVYNLMTAYFALGAIAWLI